MSNNSYNLIPLKRLIQSKWGWLIFFASLIIGLFIIFTTTSIESTSSNEAPQTQIPAQPIEISTESSKLSVVGTIEAEDIIGITAPFDGVIKQKFFSYDTTIEQHQLLLVLDTAELHQRVQEAKVAMLKAKKALNDLSHWESSSEASRAKRNLAQATQQVEQAERKLQEAEMLLRKGIISRSEYDGLAEQLMGFKSQLGAATDDVLAVSEKSNMESRDIAMIEYQQARTRFDELNKSMHLDRILAPKSGILSKAPTAAGQTPSTLDVGSRVQKGQLLFSMINTNRLRVVAKVDEIDIVDLHPGMPVMISFESQDMMPIQGHLKDISAIATQGSNGSRSASFDIRVEMPSLDERQRKRLRVGMSCNLSLKAAGVLESSATLEQK